MRMSVYSERSFSLLSQPKSPYPTHSIDLVNIPTVKKNNQSLPPYLKYIRIKNSPAPKYHLLKLWPEIRFNTLFYSLAPISPVPRQARHSPNCYLRIMHHIRHYVVGQNTRTQGSYRRRGSNVASQIHFAGGDWGFFRYRCASVVPALSHSTIQLLCGNVRRRLWVLGRMRRSLFSPGEEGALDEVAFAL